MVEAGHIRSTPLSTIWKSRLFPLRARSSILGRVIGFDRPHTDEMEHRIRQAWKGFMTYKAEFACKNNSLKDRLRLFDSIVGPKILYGSASWCLTKECQLRLQRTQRKMLRMVVGSGRRRTVRDDGGTTGSGSEEDDSDGLEPWPEWIQRTTRAAEAQLERQHLTKWIAAWRKKVWRWAARVAAYSPTRWAWKAMSWQPEMSPRAKGRLPQGQRKRWCDDIVHFLRTKGISTDAETWMQHAADESLWAQLEEEFCQYSN